MPEVSVDTRAARHVRLSLVGLLAAVLLVAAPFPAVAQQSDSVSGGLPDDHSPQGALRRASVPGWGQIYNRQYVKLPFVYAGLSGLLAYGIYMQRRVVFYRRAHRYADWFAAGNRYKEDRDAFLQALREQGVPNPEEADPGTYENSLFRSRENTKRSRNLFFIGSGLYYALTVLDAYVSAHLLQFDVSEDLSLRAAPRSSGFAVRATVTLGE